MEVTVLVSAAILFAVSLGTAFLAGRFLNEDGARRYGIVSALAAATVFGLFFAAEVPLRPDTYWHYLPYLVLPAALFGSIAEAAGLRAIERCLIALAVASATAWLLFPTWKDLQPVALRSSILLAAYLFALAVAYRQLALRITSVQMLALLTLTAAIQTVVIANDLSLTFGLIGVVSTAALAGPTIAAWRYPRLHASSAMLLAAVLIGGGAFVSYIYQRPPATALLIMPVTPLVCFATFIPPLSRLGERTQAVLRFLTIGVLLGLISALR